MGKYINVTPTGEPMGLKGKALAIIETFNAKPIAHPPASLSELPPGTALICVVDNGPFEAAAWAYSDEELRCFAGPDRLGRPKQWLTADLALVTKLFI